MKIVTMIENLIVEPNLKCRIIARITIIPIWLGIIAAVICYPKIWTSPLCVAHLLVTTHNILAVFAGLLVFAGCGIIVFGIVFAFCMHGLICVNDGLGAGGE